MAPLATDGNKLWSSNWKITCIIQWEGKKNVLRSICCPGNIQIRWNQSNPNVLADSELWCWIFFPLHLGRPRMSARRRWEIKSWFNMAAHFWQISAGGLIYVESFPALSLPMYFLWETTPESCKKKSISSFPSAAPWVQELKFNLKFKHAENSQDTKDLLTSTGSLPEPGFHENDDWI